jgi:DNA repair protein RadC
MAFDEIPGGEHDSDHATLLSPLLARTLAQRDIPAVVNAPLAVFGSAAAVVAAGP